MPFKARTRAHRQELLNIATARGDRLAVTVLLPSRPYSGHEDEWDQGRRRELGLDERRRAVLSGAWTESERRAADGNR